MKDTHPVLKGTFLVLLFLGINFIPRIVCGQEKYFIFFKDKAGVTFDPHSYFDARAIQQRQQQGISICDSTDFPVSPNYLKRVSEIVDSVSLASRWLNGVAVYANDMEIGLVKQFSFVGSTEKMNGVGEISKIKSNSAPILKNKHLPLLKFQTERMQGRLFHENKFNGRGIRIAVLDAGFPGVDKHPAFKRLRDEHRIIATYDFVSKKDFVFSHHWHGTATLSCIVGQTDSINIGMATGAEVLLARTERAYFETYSEEENWLAAAEWADRLGANIISSSIGFTEKRYFNTDMNGHSSLVARAATIAAQKGILVVNAAGNEASTSWKTIDTPGDADSVLTVGGTDPFRDSHIYFSSLGPTSDGRMKPNVCALGHAVVANGHGYAVAYGTSFSAPLVAGFAACAWQSHRSLTNMQLFTELEKSAHLYPYFDYAHGYGIPQASYFTAEKETIDPTFNFVIVNDDIKIILSEKFSHPEEERSLGYNVERNLFYKIEDEKGTMRKYTVISTPQKEALHFHAEDFKKGDRITVHFEGYTSSFDIQPDQN